MHLHLPWLRRPTIARSINNHKNPMMFWMVVCSIQSEKCYMKLREPLLRHWTPGPTTTLLTWGLDANSDLWPFLQAISWHFEWEAARKCLRVSVCCCWVEWKRNRMSGTVFFNQGVLVWVIFLHKCSNNIINDCLNTWYDFYLTDFLNTVFIFLTK